MHVRAEKDVPDFAKGGYKIEIADVVSKRNRSSYATIDSSERLHNKTQILLTKWFARL